MESDRLTDPVVKLQGASNIFLMFYINRQQKAMRRKEQEENVQKKKDKLQKLKEKSLAGMPGKHSSDEEGITFTFMFCRGKEE